MTARISLPPALLAICLASGCAHNNDRVTLGGRTPEETVHLTSISANPAIDRATAPSAPTLDRHGWQPVVVLSPPEHVESDPHLTQLQPVYSATAERREGVHPTPESALTLDPVQYTFAEGVAGLGWAGLDVILMLPRAVAAPLRSPAESYERYTQPASVTDVAPAAPAVGG